MDASTISEPMRRVIDALLEGRPAPTDAQAALTEKERAEVAALARTAHLTKLTLARPEPTAEMEAAALERALAARRQQIAGGVTSTSREPFSLLAWFRDRFQKDDGDEA